MKPEVVSKNGGGVNLQITTRKRNKKNRCLMEKIDIFTVKYICINIEY